MARVSGGDKMDRVLADIARRIGGKGAVKVGFLEGARYPAVGRAELRAKYKRKRKQGAVAGSRGGQSVALVAAMQNFGTKNIPPRPFFTNMVKDESPGWGPALGVILTRVDYNAPQALALMGELIAGQLRQAIHDTNSPPLAESTIERKGFEKPLVDTGHMLNSVDYEVTS